MVVAPPKSSRPHAEAIERALSLDDRDDERCQAQHGKEAAER